MYFALKRHRWTMLKESELSFEKEKVLEASVYWRFCATKWLNIAVCVRLTGVSAECRFILQQLWKANLGTQAGVHLEGVPLNTGFTVRLLGFRRQHCRIFGFLVIKSCHFELNLTVLKSCHLFCRHKKGAVTKTKSLLKSKKLLSPRRLLDSVSSPAWSLLNPIWLICLSISWYCPIVNWCSSSTSTACLCLLLHSL